VHCSDSVKTCGAINPIEQRCRNNSLHWRAKINTARSTSRLKHIVYRAVWLCHVPAGAKLCLESSTSEVYFMALTRTRCMRLCSTPLHKMW